MAKHGGNYAQCAHLSGQKSDTPPHIKLLPVNQWKIFLWEKNVFTNQLLQAYGNNFDWRGWGTSEYCFTQNGPFH